MERGEYQYHTTTGKITRKFIARLFRIKNEIVARDSVKYIQNA